MSNGISDTAKMLATATPEARARFQEFADIANEQYEVRKKVFEQFRKQERLLTTPPEDNRA
jgi:hypothetical protein